jgi:hypothetical protein
MDALTLWEGQLWFPQPHRRASEEIDRIAAVLASESRVAQAALIACRAYGRPHSARLLLDVQVDWPEQDRPSRPRPLRVVGAWLACLALARTVQRRLASTGQLSVSVACGPIRLMPIAWEFLWRDRASQAASWGQLQPALADARAVIYRRPRRGRFE